MTLEQLSQNAAWESKTTDDILLAMVRAQLAAKRRPDLTAAAAATNGGSGLATTDANNTSAVAPEYMTARAPHPPAQSQAYGESAS